MKLIDNIRQYLSRTKFKRLYIVGFSFLVVLFVFLFTSHGLLKRAELESQRTKLHSDILIEKQKRDSLKTIIKTLRYDTTEIERIAREKFGMVKDGEEVIYFKKSIK